MIRNIEDKDIIQVLDIYNYYIENTLITYEEELLDIESFSYRVHSIAKDYPFIVYEEDGKILGYAYLSAFNYRSAYSISADLSIYVDKDVHHKSIGSLLYNKIEELAKEKGIRKIISLVTDSNEISKRFHEKHNFEYIGTIKNSAIKFNTLTGVSYYAKDI